MAHKQFYRSEFLYALASSIITPFLPVYALMLGASNTLIGLQSTLPNIVSTLSQLFWSNTTEGVKRKRLLVILGGVLWSIVWIPIAFVTNPYQLIVLLTIQAFFLAISIPAWTAIIIESTPSYKRANISSRVYLFSGIGSFAGTMLAGIILAQYGFVHFIFYMVFFFGVLSKLFIMKIKEPVTHPIVKKGKLFSLRHFKDFRKHKELNNLTIARAFLSFSVSLTGPLLTVYVIKNLSGSALDIAIISAISGIAAIISYNAWGKLIDYIGKRIIILGTLVPISLVPFWYYVAPTPQFIYAFAILGGMSWAGLNLAVFTYLSDIMPKGGMRKHIATFNTTTGISSSAGYLLGGVLADSMSIGFVLLLSVAFRALSISLFSALSERTGFKPKSIIPYGSQNNITQNLGNFAATYSLLADEIRRETLKISRLPIDLHDKIAESRIIERVLDISPWGYFVVPEGLRPKFEAPGGSIFSSYQEMFEKMGMSKDNKKSLRMFESKGLVTVGDMTTYNALGAGLKPHIIVYDGKEGNKHVEKSIKSSIHAYKGLYHRVSNPYGRITKEFWNVVRKVFPIKRKKAKIKIEGNNNFTLVPIILEAPAGTRIIYGIPGKGIVLVEVNKKIKNVCRELLKQVKLTKKKKK
jgi:uncharacterized protein (UPF0218 family)/MFS family permease